MNKKTDLQSHIINFSGLILFLISTAVFAFLTLESAKLSYYPPTEYSFYTWSIPAVDSIFENALYSGLMIIFLILFYRLIGKLEKKYPEKIIIIRHAIVSLLITTYFVAGIFFILYTPYYPSGDQLNTTAAAAYALEGNYLMFTRLGYIGIYSFQKGLVFFYHILFMIFGAFNYMPVMALTVLMNTLTITMGVILIRDMGGSNASMIVYSVFMFFCLPYFYLLPYAYGDLPSIFGTMALICFLYKYIKKRKVRFAFLAGLGGVFAVMTRGTAWITLFALAITVAMISLSEKRIKPLVTIGLISIICWLSLSAISIGYEKISGFDRNTGSPFISILAMGMQETGGYPGVYNNYQQKMYEQYEGDREKCKEEASAYISARLKEFQNDPAMTKDFYLRKLRMQWIDPLFESITHTHSFRKWNKPEGFFESLYSGKVHDLSYKFMNRYQTFVYLICFLFSAKTLLNIIIKRSSTNLLCWFFYIHLIGGFILSIIWETKARYMLPFFVFLIPLTVLFFERNKEK